MREPRPFIKLRVQFYISPTWGGHSGFDAIIAREEIVIDPPSQIFLSGITRAQ